ncbi:MAG: succinate dehydrogenase assembly factor 2 [Pseudomonadota bacterium]|nr:succinate dehydrogenase assembly factor 2 [Pseudomonadota bacterium]
MDHALLLKRLRYRSWHRGCKETDLVLGNFADTHLAGLAPELLPAYERLLDENDADIWEWLAGKASSPAEYEELLVMMTPAVRGA